MPADRPHLPLDEATRWTLDALRAEDALVPDRPDLAPLRQLGAQFDRQMTAALDDVPLPVGLPQRLLAQLAPSPASLPAAPPVLPSRRRFLGLAAVAAATVAVAAGVWWWQQPDGQLRPGELLEAAVGLFHELDAQPQEAGATLVTAPLATAPRNFPVSDELAFQPATARWRRLPAALANETTVAYELRSPDGQSQAVLFVLHRDIPSLLASPPAMPTLPPTQGVCAAAWQSGNITYVLVVRGGQRDYQSFLKSVAGEVT